MDTPIMRKRGIYGVIAAVMVVGVTTLACLLYIERTQYGNNLQGRYQRELYDLAGNVQNLESDLSKVLVAFSPHQQALLFSDIWRQAGTASDKINSLPINHTAVSQTSKFLSQVSDFAYSLVRNQDGSGKLSDEQWKTISQLKSNAAYLKDQLSNLQLEIEDGNIKWSEISYEGSQVLGASQKNMTDSMFTEIDKQLQEYPVLIYDGPFSENVLSISPKVLSEPLLTEEKARDIAASIIGRDNISKIDLYSRKSGGSIPVYPLQITLKGRDAGSPIYMDISRNGGHIIYMLDQRAVGLQNIDNKKAIDSGLKYLDKCGFKDMVPMFSQSSYNVLTVNYVFTQSNDGFNVLIYPDQVKLNIALDNGGVIGMEAGKYFTAHTPRTFVKPVLSVSQAREKASPYLKITNTRMALIPLLSKKEVLCYEFVGKRENSTYIVYINAVNGNEEDILEIIDTPGGQLAM